MPSSAAGLPEARHSAFLRLFAPVRTCSAVGKKEYTFAKKDDKIGEDYGVRRY
jgi:hypothetical protein